MSAGFLYFLPGAKPSDIPSRLERWGLAYLNDEPHRRLFPRQCTGPGGQHGLIVGSSANWKIEQVKMSADITWVKFPKTFGESQASLGYFADQMPGPAELARSEQISGQHLTLADGNRWLVPNAKVITQEGDSACNLPLSFGLDDDTGEWIANQVLPKYRAIWQHANNYLESMFEAIAESKKTGKESVSWTIPDHQQLVVDALQVNYRVSSRELATLGVLTSDLASQIAKVLIDDAGYERIKKKADSDTGPG